MERTEYPAERSGGGAAWIYVPIILILFLGGVLSAGAYMYGEPDLTIVESIAAGFAGLAALIIGLIGAALGIIVGLIGALLGIVAAGGAVAVTLFIVGSPIIALILFVLLMRRGRSCPDPAAHK